MHGWESILPSDLSGFELRMSAMQCLDQREGYDWSGIYRLEGEMLVLDAYVGAQTDHTHIPVGRGVCGTAVAENTNKVIADVRNLDNYLACSLETRSEIVVLVRNAVGEILGQIDIDSHTPNRFTTEDEVDLEALATILASRWN